MCVSTIDHLEELRSRLILVPVAVALAFGVCFSQNHELLPLVDAPLAHQTQQQVRDGNGPLGAAHRSQQNTRNLAVQLRTRRVVDASAHSCLHEPAAGVTRALRPLTTAPSGSRDGEAGAGR